MLLTSFTGHTDQLKYMLLGEIGNKLFSCGLDN